MTPARPVRRLASMAAAVMLGTLLAGALGACTTTVHDFPPAGSTPQAVTGSTTAGTVASVIRSLDETGLQAEITTRPFRPSEGPLLAAAPRTVIEVALPDDPEHAFVVVYAFPTEEAALRAAKDHAAYLAAGIGGAVQYPPGTRFAISVVRSNVVFFHWLPLTSPDARMGMIEDTVGSIGTTVQVPR